MNKARQAGFTLIEIVIVVSIVGILAMVAYPAYQDQVYKARRGDAMVSLLNTAQRFERCYTEAGDYTAAVCPTGFPIISAEGHYSIALGGAGATANTYTLVATARGAQAGDVQCMNFNLDQLGNKTATNTNCW